MEVTTRPVDFMGGQVFAGQRVTNDQQGIVWRRKHDSYVSDAGYVVDWVSGPLTNRWSHRWELMWQPAPGLSYVRVYRGHKATECQRAAEIHRILQERGWAG